MLEQRSPTFLCFPSAEHDKLDSIADDNLKENHNNLQEQRSPTFYCFTPAENVKGERKAKQNHCYQNSTKKMKLKTMAKQNFCMKKEVKRQRHFNQRFALVPIAVWIKIITRKYPSPFPMSRWNTMWRNVHRIRLIMKVIWLGRSNLQSYNG